MKRFISVAALQMEILPLDITANLRKAEQLLKNASTGQKLDLAVFPEDCITGPIPDNLESSLDNDSQALNVMKNLARKYETYIVCGSFIKRKNGKYYNTSLLIDRKGQIILEYAKNNLWILERSYLTSGKSLPVVKTSIGTIGLTICWDLAFPDTFRELAKQGADIICCPSYWTRQDGAILVRKYPEIPSEINMIDALCPARAMENLALVIYSNGAGIGRVHLKNSDLELDMIGHSQICAPVIGTARVMDNNDEGYICYTYDRHMGRDAESRYLLRKDMLTAK
jgi:predicted amidohydrolase